MNLLEVRQQFRTLSGRYDLVNSDGSDNGADFFINSGQRYLDRRFHFPKGPGRLFKNIQSGDYGVSFQYSRALKEVWCASGSDDARWQLEKMDMQDFRVKYASSYTTLDTGDPIYYSPVILRTVPDVDRMQIGDADVLSGFADIMATASYDYNGIVFGPPAGGELQLELVGYFYTMPLNSDDHESFWSVVHNDILIMAAMRQVEAFNRNTQGRQDWDKTIDIMLLDIDKDVVEEDLPEEMEMGG